MGVPLSEVHQIDERRTDVRVDETISVEIGQEPVVGSPRARRGDSVSGVVATVAVGVARKAKHVYQLVIHDGLKVDLARFV